MAGVDASTVARESVNRARVRDSATLVGGRVTHCCVTSASMTGSVILLRRRAPTEWSCSTPSPSRLRADDGIGPDAVHSWLGLVHCPSRLSRQEIERAMNTNPPGMKNAPARIVRGQT